VPFDPVTIALTAADENALPSQAMAPVLVVAAIYAAIAGAAWIAPQAVLGAAAKEGAIEVVSHAVLAGGIAAWALRSRVRPRWPAVAMALVLAVVLGEELDWGAHLGVPAIADALTRAGGAPNLHNAWLGASYLLFAAPFCAWFSVPFVPERWRARLQPHVPSRGEAFAFGLIAAVAIASMLVPAAWEGALDEIDETLLYGLVAASAFRR
jgi:hypothetical protein